MDKLFQATAWGAKATSDYKKDRNKAQQKKAKEVAEAKARDKGKGSDPKAKDKPRGCWGCGEPWKDREELKKHQATCPAMNKVCTGCK